jgi:hypothetical protein
MIYTQPAAEAVLNKTVIALKNNGVDVIVADNGADTLAIIKKLIPAGASVANGASRTLEQIGFIDYLKSGVHGWVSLHDKITAEPDPQKRAALRKQAVLSDFYLGSVHALTRDGAMIIASNTGSQLPPIVFTSPNLIFVVGSQKIVRDVNAGLKRLNEYVVPLEDERMRKIYKTGTMLSKLLIFYRENQLFGRKIHLILVRENLGF